MREKIIEVLSEKYRRSGEMTYVIANIIGFRGNAAPVRRELERMTRDGLVERAPDNTYARQIKWRLKQAAAKEGAQECLQHGLN
ncbi:hypothetical protein QRD40_10625 [Comamonas sp. Y6]|uniref:Uncharacterized protein n=1 Tax=Comamonas resistens TaxID=3046670 RepID=A0ABY8SWJ2_9BURK|nr:hypothetical protein [Comamonas resistens]MDL5036800.1 hypothetical protein [Comamonas resistens]WHS67110.1 hypothetical protein QMY55_08340 [Comamonas resistens]